MAEQLKSHFSSWIRASNEAGQPVDASDAFGPLDEPGFCTRPRLASIQYWVCRFFSVPLSLVQVLRALVPVSGEFVTNVLRRETRGRACPTAWRALRAAFDLPFDLLLQGSPFAIAVMSVSHIAWATWAAHKLGVVDLVEPTIIFILTLILGERVVLDEPSDRDPLALD